MHRFGHWEVEYLDYKEGPSLPEIPLESLVIVLNEVEELLTILLCQGISWEIFCNVPWESDAVGANEIHPMSVTPYTLVDQPKIAF